MTDIMIANPAGAYANAFQGGMAQGAQVSQMTQQNALRDLYKSQGAGIANGDPNALNALAGLDPMAALGVRQTTQQMAASQEQLQMARDAAKRAVQEHADKMTAAEAAAESDKMGHVMEGAMMAPDEGAYNSWLTQNGVDPAHYPFAQRDLAAAAVLGMKEVLDAKAAQTPKAPDLTSSQKDYQFYSQQETGAGRQPLSFNDWDLQARKAGATNVNIGGADQQATKDSNAATSGDAIYNAARKARELAGGNGLATGTIGMGMALLPESDAAEVNRQVEVLKSNASVAGIQAMRDASKTGGAVGSPSDKDMALLQAKAGALDPKSGAHFQEQLDDYERTLYRVTYGQVKGDKIFAATRNGTPPTEVVLPPETGAGVKNPAVTGSDGVAAAGTMDFSKMALPDLTAVNVGSLDDSQKAALSARLKELGF